MTERGSAADRQEWGGNQAVGYWREIARRRHSLGFWVGLDSLSYVALWIPHKVCRVRLY